MLCVEDAHLLDEATADVLHQLVAGGGGDPLLVMLAYRAEWIRTSLPRGITELARSDRTLSLQLGPLDDSEIAELVALAASVQPAPEAVARIARAATEARSSRSSSTRALASGAAEAAAADGAPGDHRSASSASTRRRSDALTTLAVAEDELDLASVLALTGLDERDAFALLDAALDTGVLVVAGTHYRFRHELVRQALIDELPSHRRLQLHRDAALRLVTAGGAPELIADHWLKGERPGEAVDWLLAATRRGGRRSAPSPTRSRRSSAC